MSKNAKYINLSKQIIKEIQQKNYTANDRLPTEFELMDEYQVSRVTVRKALDELIRLGYVNRIAGKGHFVADNIIEKELNEVVSFTKSAILRGEIPSTVVLEMKEMLPTPYVAKMLKIKMDESILAMKRIRLTNGFPLIFEESFWLKSVVKQATKENMSNSMFSYLKEQGVYPTKAFQELDAIGANEEIAQYLQVPIQYPLLRSSMVTVDQNLIPFELSINYHRTDRLKLSLIRNLSE